MKRCDVAVIGGGIIGTSAAAYLAEAGTSVRLFEREQIGAGASGRNSGVIQHPFDPAFATLHHESIALYRELSEESDEFTLAAAPAGLLLVSFDADAVTAAAEATARAAPELRPAALSAAEVAELEPMLARDIAACRLETGYPVAPAAATAAFASRARRAGADLRTAVQAEVVVEVGRVTGVRLDGAETVACEQVLVAAGPWTPALVPGWAEGPPIASVWGVVVGTSLPNVPSHVLEELGLDESGRAPDRMFSLVTAGTVSSVGSTFLAQQPAVASAAAAVLERASMFVPSLAGRRIESVRACARPVSFDGRPIIGPVLDVAGLYVCSGHGPWGISTGPASALLAARQMLGLAAERPEFSAERVLRRSRRITEFA